MEDYKIASRDITLNCQDLSVEFLVLDDLDKACLFDLLQLEDLKELEVVHERADLRLHVS